MTKLTAQQQEICDRFEKGTATIDDYEILGDYKKNIYQILRKKMNIIEKYGKKGYMTTFISRPIRNKYHLVEIVWCSTIKAVKILQDNFSNDENNWSCGYTKLNQEFILEDDIDANLDNIVHELDVFDVQEHFGYEYYWEHRGNIDSVIDEMEKETGRKN